MEFNTHMSCGLKLNLSSNGWYKYLTKLLKNIRGVSYQIDVQAGMAYISGKGDAKKLLERIFKADKKDATVCWMRTGEEYGATPCSGKGYYDDNQSLTSYDPYNNYNYMGSYAPTSTPRPSPPPPPPPPPNYYPPPPPPPSYYPPPLPPCYCPPPPPLPDHYPAYGYHNPMAHYYPQPPPPPPLPGHYPAYCYHNPMAHYYPQPPPPPYTSYY